MIYDVKNPGTDSWVRDSHKMLVLEKRTNADILRWFYIEHQNILQDFCKWSIQTNDVSTINYEIQLRIKDYINAIKLKKRKKRGGVANSLKWKYTPNQSAHALLRVFKRYKRNVSTEWKSINIRYSFKSLLPRKKYPDKS